MHTPGLFDVAPLLLDVDAGKTCGENLEYDPQFLLLEEALAGKPEVQYGDSLTLAVPPDWKAVHRLASELLLSTRDLRLAVSITRSSLFFSGFPGLACGLALIEGLLQSHWDSVHPQCDAEEEFDPTARVNTLMSLMEPGTALREIKEAPLLQSVKAGRFSLRDIDIATGELVVVSAEPRPTFTLIEAAFHDADLTVLDEISGAIAAACASTERIEILLTERVGNGHAVSFRPLLAVLERARDFMATTAASHPQSLRNHVGADDPDSQIASASGVGDGGPQRVAGEITSRQDVLNMLRKINAFYVKHEPSSPIPVLLDRVHRLVGMNFMEIMRDLSPDGVQQMMRVTGIKEE